jgi:hypothetical protein
MAAISDPNSANPRRVIVARKAIDALGDVGDTAEPGQTTS